ncbi:PP2C family serine/threonine-protein phosphatase [Gramella sp. KN1008]|uniref:PP2C family protein-serine/threonine phosphatase n=1 Tax=Gramella sp. KN1008 TaxID=2529298 RepID=UPI00103D0AF5|nr:PP2C family serine/threonine-protein phosphatase [Gramella sp. KN1008]TBW28252.1 serine/threonine-protein phosphatase [Gramella sp. KN1008]
MLTYSFTHIGKKTNNEDAYRLGSNLYVVCDGVGGANRGEVASSSISDYLVSNYDQPINAASEIKEAIINSVLDLNQIIHKNPEYDGTATTVAGIFCNPELGIFSFHIGDSRIFLVRPTKKIFWHTWDHSMVAELVKNGDITRDEGRSHPMNNRIYKALKNSEKENIPDPEIKLISDIKPGDRLLICSDGVLEAFTDHEIIELLTRKDISLHDLGKQVEEICKAESIDNNTAIILEVEKGDFKINNTEALEWETLKSLSMDNKGRSITPSVKGWFRSLLSNKN